MKKSKKLAHAIMDLIMATHPTARIHTEDSPHKRHSGTEPLLIPTIIQIGHKCMSIYKSTLIELYDVQTSNYSHYIISEIHQVQRILAKQIPGPQSPYNITIDDKTGANIEEINRLQFIHTRNPEDSPKSHTEQNEPQPETHHPQSPEPHQQSQP